jgi:hypothetical protein
MGPNPLTFRGNIVSKFPMGTPLFLSCGPDPNFTLPPLRRRLKDHDELPVLKIVKTYSLIFLFESTKAASEELEGNRLFTVLVQIDNVSALEEKSATHPTNRRIFQR